MPVMRRFSERRPEMVVVVCGSQMGKTEALLCIVGHRFDDGPYMPTLWVAPTERMWRKLSRDRVDTMLRTTKDLWSKTKKGHWLKLDEKWIGNIPLRFAHAGSASELAMNPAGLVLVDERDRMVADVGGEGDPLVLAQARTKNYAGAKVGVTSTPTLEGASPIWSLWEEGTREKWAWPCPHCGDLFIPELKLLRWPEHATPAQARKAARVVCPHCGGELTDRHKAQANRWGRFIPHQVDVEGNETPLEAIPDNSLHSFWISGLCSPWITFGQLAEKLVGAYRSGEQERIQGVVNTYGGEVFRVKGDAPEWETVMARRADYEPHTVPEGVQLITIGVDVQKDRLYWACRGWGFNAESWGIAEGVLWGDTAYDGVWVALAQLIKNPVNAAEATKGAQYAPRFAQRVFIDSGYRPGKKWQRPENVIYQFCRRLPGLAFPTKGQQTMDVPLRAKQVDVTASGRLVRGGVKLWHINTHLAKSNLYAKIRAPAEEPGGFHCHRQITEDYAKQLTSEELLLKASGKTVWMEKGDNHYLDCEVGAWAAALSLNVYQLKPSAPAPKKPPPASPPARGRAGFGRHSL